MDGLDRFIDLLDGQTNFIHLGVDGGFLLVDVGEDVELHVSALFKQLLFHLCVNIQSLIEVHGSFSDQVEEFKYIFRHEILSKCRNLGLLVELLQQLGIDIRSQDCHSLGDGEDDSAKHGKEHTNNCAD